MPQQAAAAVSNASSAKPTSAANATTGAAAAAATTTTAAASASSSSSTTHVDGNINNNINNSNNNNTNSDQLRRDLARQLDSRIAEFGGSISTEWEHIKRFVSADILANMSEAVRVDVESLLEHPQLRDLVKRLRHGRPDAETQSEVLDKMTAAILPKVRRNHRQYLDRLNQQVAQMIVQLMRNDQLATVIDDEKLLHRLFRLAASEDETSQGSN